MRRRSCRARNQVSTSTQTVPTETITAATVYAGEEPTAHVSPDTSRTSPTTAAARTIADPTTISEIPRPSGVHATCRTPVTTTAVSAITMNTSAGTGYPPASPIPSTTATV